jgi:hypothetical protein
MVHYTYAIEDGPDHRRQRAGQIDFNTRTGLGDTQIPNQHWRHNIAHACNDPPNDVAKTVGPTVTRGRQQVTPEAVLMFPLASGGRGNGAR